MAEEQNIIRLPIPVCPKGKLCPFWTGKSCSHFHSMIEALDIIRRQSHVIDKLNRENERIRKDIVIQKEKREFADELIDEIDHMVHKKCKRYLS